MSIYEKTFAKTDRTDAILIVQGKKLHVEKALLSYHSAHFNALFNAEFKEKSMAEIPIEDVNFKEFATLLSLFQRNPIVPTENNAEKLLELADRFLITSVKRQLELFLISTKIDNLEKIRIAEKYELDDLMTRAAQWYNRREEFKEMKERIEYQQLKDSTKVKLFYRFLKI
ncbi:hypothetical protein CRE_19779 [Caenorhabditis remanei]|uniref:BTB domain-containing protein n=1 Tax=Caenorhabditis remanei TaxID=31234 RepID=E3MTA0_CAERE|nr:hypothetical protein CRE_19779 [Caenorhabditis remanei]